MRRFFIHGLIFVATLAGWAAMAADSSQLTGTAPQEGSALFQDANPSQSAGAIPLATGSAAPADAAPESRTASFALALVNRLVQRGLLTKADADDLIKEAHDEAAAEHAQAQAETSAAVQAAVSQVEQRQAEAVPPPLEPGAFSVHYIPSTVKDELRDDVEQAVMKQARDERWAAPNAVPQWTKLLRFTADVRTRYEADILPPGNANTGEFPNFNSINTGAPFDTAGTTFSPQYDVDQSRNQFRIRARLGVEADLDNGWTMGIRLATGQNDSPVSENQTVGLANNGQGGDFSKYAVWLDRAFLKYEVGGAPDKNLMFEAGRFDNPFLSTPIIWANDLAFDGLVLQGRYKILPTLTPFLTVGAFPVFNTDFNFASNQPAKYSSEDKYLFAAQLGAGWNISKDFNLKAAGALYYFDNISGKLSSPFTPLSSSDQGDTDDSRPAFAQNGNTYFPIRDIVPTAANDFGTTDQFQYYGLAAKFQDLDFYGALNYDHFAPFRVTLAGEFIKNLAFDAASIGAVAVNNRASNTSSGALGGFAGGDTAWIITLTAGSVALEKFGDWNVDLGYRYVESDAVVDGFNDTSFGTPLSGTNLKGFTIGGSFALGRSVSLGLRWLSANSIVGPPFKSDVLQLDLYGSF
jgi:hypothetical protein